MKWTVPNSESWHKVAKAVAARLRDGDILAVQGVLGAGKTTFVQVLAKELGAKLMPKSPSFSMLRSYAIDHKGLRRFLHVDAYRIDNEVDLLPLDLDEELLIPGTVLAIEWPENVPKWLSNHKVHKLTIEIRKYGRKVHFLEK